MKINETNPGQAIESIRGPSETKAPRPVDRVTVEDQTRMRAIAKEAQESVAVDRAERLSDLKAQIHAGTYRPDSGRIADEILRDAEIRAKLSSLLF